MWKVGIGNETIGFGGKELLSLYVEPLIYRRVTSLHTFLY